MNIRRALVVLMTIPILGAALSASAQEGPPVSAASYINPDTGAATENANVDEDSSCETPDRRDRQRLSDEGASNKNVHNDACLFDAQGEAFDGTVTWVVKGVGAISACPDPDLTTAVATPVTNGPKTATIHDHDGNGRVEHCHQSGFQEKDMEGDAEYHARLNNDSSPGRQRVIFCHDPDQDAAGDAADQPEGHGCSDETIKDRILIRWRGTAS